MGLFKRIRDQFLLKDKIFRLGASLDDIMALQVLQGVFGKPVLFPFTNFSLNPIAILHAVNEINLNHRQCIVEFGSGISTVYLARAIKNTGRPVQFFAIDNNEDWLKAIKQMLKEHDCEDYVELVHAPITPLNISNLQTNYSQPTHWYQTELLGKKLIQADRKIDMIIIDGPSANTSAFARYPALPFLQNNLAENFFILLDDIRRSDEHAILKQWATTLQATFGLHKMYGTIHVGQHFSTAPIKTHIF